MDRVSLDDISDDAVIVDIRNRYYYNIDHVKGSINIPYYELLNNYSHYLNKYNRYYLYCDTGEQSFSIANRLREFGYFVYSIDGGFLEYKDKKKYFR